MTADALTFLTLDIESRRGPDTGEADGRGGRPDVTADLVKQMTALTPKLGQPEWTDDVEDIARIWSQPEMLDL